MENAIWKAIMLGIAAFGLLAGALGAMRMRAVSGNAVETMEVQGEVLILFCVILSGIFAAVFGAALAGGLAYL
jgi:hypothetical protein